MTAVVSPQELTRHSVVHPAGPHASVPLFRTWEDAIRHFSDHVLTAPECSGWLIILPTYREIIDPDDFIARQRYAEEAGRTRGLSAQALYDLYARAVQQTALEAAILRWYNTEADVTVGLGTSGVLLLIQGCYVRTAFVPGQGNAAGRPRCMPDGGPRTREALTGTWHAIRSSGQGRRYSGSQWRWPPAGRRTMVPRSAIVLLRLSPSGSIHP